MPSSIECPKCGFDNVSVAYSYQKDILHCQCNRCGFNFDREPLDRYYPFLGGPDKPKDENPKEDVTTIVGGGTTRE